MSRLLQGGLDRLLKLVAHNNAYDLPADREAKAIQGLVVAGLLFVCLVTLWIVAASQGWLNTHFVPAPEHIGKAFQNLLWPDDWYKRMYFREYSFIEHHAISFGYRLGIGYISGLSLGILVGLYAGASEVRGPTFNLLVNIPFNNMPKLVLLMLFVVWFGIGDTSVILITGIATFLTVSVITYDKIANNSDQRLVESGVALGLSPLVVAWRISLPLAIPTIFSGLKLGLYRAIGILFFAELLVGSNGTGALVGWAGEHGDAALVFALVIVVLATIGILTLILKLIERSLTPHLRVRRNN